MDTTTGQKVETGTVPVAKHIEVALWLPDEVMGEIDGGRASDLERVIIRVLEKYFGVTGVECEADIPR